MRLLHDTGVPAELASACHVIIACVFDDAALRHVFGEFMQARQQPGCTFVDTSTVAPPLTAELAQQAEAGAVGATLVFISDRRRASLLLCQQSVP